MTQFFSDSAVTVAFRTNAPPEKISGEPHLSTATLRLVTEIPAKLACVSATHELEALLASAAFCSVAAAQVEGTRPFQPVRSIFHNINHLGM